MYTHSLQYNLPLQYYSHLLPHLFNTLKATAVARTIIFYMKYLYCPKPIRNTVMKQQSIKNTLTQRVYLCQRQRLSF